MQRLCTCVLAILLFAVVLHPVMGDAGIENLEPPYIGFDAAGVLFLVAAPNGEAGSYPTQVALEALAMRLESSPAALVSAFSIYLDMTASIDLATTRSARELTYASITMAYYKSGFHDLLLAAFRQAELPRAPLLAVVSAMSGAIPSSVPFGSGKSHDCAVCRDGQKQSVFCGSGLCVQDCGAFDGACYEAGAVGMQELFIHIGTN